MVRLGSLLFTVVVVACGGTSRSDGPAHGAGSAGRSSSAGVGTGTAGDGAGRGGATMAGGGGSGGMSSGVGGSAGASTGGTSGGAGKGGAGGASGTHAAGTGSGGAATGGESGTSAAGEGGAPSECAEPNPEGCRDKGCPGGETCAMTSGLCIPSSCACADGGWACTPDCGGGVCVPAQCPEGCEASSETFCDEEEGVTWVCGTSGAFDPSELQEAGCTDLGTQVPRYCCPSTFKPECR